MPDQYFRLMIKQQYCSEINGSYLIPVTMVFGRMHLWKVTKLNNDVTTGNPFWGFLPPVSSSAGSDLYDICFL